MESAHRVPRPPAKNSTINSENYRWSVKYWITFLALESKCWSRNPPQSISSNRKLHLCHDLRSNLSEKKWCWRVVALLVTNIFLETHHPGLQGVAGGVLGASWSSGACCAVSYLAVDIGDRAAVTRDQRAVEVKHEGFWLKLSCPNKCKFHSSLFAVSYQKTSSSN